MITKSRKLTKSLNSDDGAREVIVPDEQSHSEAPSL